MANNTLKKTYTPMTETMYYILLSFLDPRHGYGVFLHVKELTNGRIHLGAGTIYNSIAKLERDGLIVMNAHNIRRKIYEITNLGRSVLDTEILRLEELLNNGKVCLNEN